MELFATPEKSDCTHWTNRYESDTDLQWLTDITSNLFLGMAFSLSYFLEEPWTWIRVLLIVGHVLAAYLSISRCQMTAFIWALLLIAANVYRLLKTAYNNRPSRIPKYLQDMYNNLFKTYNISRPEFSTIIDKSRIHGIGPEESLYDDGHLRHDHVDLCILVSGKMTVWCDGLPIHTIYPGQFINSIEWTSVLQIQENENGHDFGWEQQVLIKPDEDSVYLRIFSSHLEWLKGHRGGHLWRVLEAIVCKDVTRKLYQMNEGFERMIQHRERMKRKALLRQLVHSVSLEALHITSRGWNVSDNWLSADNRTMLLGCPHSADGMPTSAIANSSRSYSNLNEIPHAVNNNVAYLLRNSHAELVKEWEKSSTNVIPSLRMQTLRIDRFSCRFRDDSIIRDYDWDQSWEHCGNCSFCKPLAEGEAQDQQHPTVKS